MARRAALACALLALGAAAVFGADKDAPAPAPEPPRPRLVILNFVSAFDSGDLGARTGYSLRSKLRRSQRFVIPDELDFDDLEEKGFSRPLPADVAEARRQAARFDASLIVWGEVAKNGAYRISLSAIDLSGDGTVIRLEKTAADLRRFAVACGELADEVALKSTGAGYRETFPSKSTEGYVRVGENLVKNGSFEKGASSPDSWEKVDGLCSFWREDAARGRVIMLDTDVYLAEWQDWRKRFDAGEPASAAPKKTATSGPKYDTVGGTYGVHLYSDPIAVRPGAAYSIEFDAKGPEVGDFFFPKVFVKGYGEAGASMELYNMYKAAKLTASGKWQHFSRVFHPTERTPQVKTMKVMLYAYWPPAEHCFDNVEIYEVKKAPAAVSSSASTLSSSDAAAKPAVGPSGE